MASNSLLSVDFLEDAALRTEIKALLQAPNWDRIIQAIGQTNSHAPMDSHDYNHSQNSDIYSAKNHLYSKERSVFSFHPYRRDASDTSMFSVASVPRRVQETHSRRASTASTCSSEYWNGSSMQDFPSSLVSLPVINSASSSDVTPVHPFDFFDSCSTNTLAPTPISTPSPRHQIDALFCETATTLSCLLVNTYSGSSSESYIGGGSTTCSTPSSPVGSTASSHEQWGFFDSPTSEFSMSVPVESHTLTSTSSSMTVTHAQLPPLINLPSKVTPNVEVANNESTTPAQLLPAPALEKKHKPTNLMSAKAQEVPKTKSRRKPRKCMWDGPGGCPLTEKDKTQWRHGPLGAGTLCNRHGLQYKYPSDREKRNEHRRRTYAFKKMVKVGRIQRF